MTTEKTLMRKCLESNFKNGKRNTEMMSELKFISVTEKINVYVYVCYPVVLPSASQLQESS